MKRSHAHSLIFVSGWLISCSTNTPESVITEFHEALSSGKCEEARDLVIEDAADYLQGTIDAGCEPYELFIEKISCREPLNEMVRCTCFYTYEGKQDTDYWFRTYGMKKAEDKWKIYHIPVDYNK